QIDKLKKQKQATDVPDNVLLWLGESRFDALYYFLTLEQSLTRSHHAIRLEDKLAIIDSQNQVLY
ncbi:hypothetical protein Tco_1442471, partial [Tanacetum coccineum]